MSSFEHDLLKKDPDALIEAIDDELGQVVITTSVDMVKAGMLVRQGPQLTDLIDDQLLERESKRRRVPVKVRILRFVFLVQMVVALVVSSVGYIVFYILRFDENHKVGLTTFIVSFVCLGLVYAMLVWSKQRADYIILPLLLLFVFDVALFVGSLSSLVGTLVPLLSCSTVMVQCCCVYAYSLDHQEVEPIHVLGYMFVGHLIAWLAGIFVFVREEAWLWGMILFFFGLFHVGYAAWQLVNMDRYCLSQRDRILALLYFYIDPVVQLPTVVKELQLLLRKKPLDETQKE